MPQVSFFSLQGFFPALLNHETLCFLLTSTLPSSTSLASIAAIKIERMLLLEVVQLEKIVVAVNHSINPYYRVIDGNSEK